MAAKVKIPKRIAGVKIPKKVRKRAKRAIKRTGSPIVKELAAAALGAAAQAAADGSLGRGRQRDSNGAGADAGEHRGHRGPSVRVRLEHNRLGESIRAAALDGIRRFLEGMEEGLRNAAAAAADAGAELRDQDSKPEGRRASGRRPAAGSE